MLVGLFEKWFDTIAADSIDLPVIRLEVGRSGRSDDYVLHITPSQIAVSLQG
jgi:hypothetical protein